jgi:hypothetical protein
MKRFGGICAVLGAATLLLLFGSTLPSQAYQEEHPQEEHHEDAKPAEKAKPPHDQDAKPAEKAKPPHDQEAKPPKEEKPSSDAKAPEKAKDTRETKTVEHSEVRTQSRSTVKHGPVENGRIPDAQFHAHFGREHTFRVGHPVIVEGHPRFQYGGYWFGFGEPWPVGWAYTDDVYVDFIDGQYYLIDPVHPGVRLVLNIVL